MRFDFGTDEDKAQAALHKLDVWKQAFRLDKKLQYKLDRPEPAASETPSGAPPAAKPAEKPGAKGKSKSSEATHDKSHKTASTPNGKVSLLVRLYFSTHEKLSEQRWVDRIPTEEPFQAASPKVIKPNDSEFADTEKQFEDLA
jgi:hypothetical protein